MNLAMQIGLGFFLGVAIAAAAWKAGALSGSGAAAAALSGGLIFGLGGLDWAALLLTFFISSSLLSRAFGRRKAALNEKFSKGHQRDWGQVLANGGLGAGLVILAAIDQEHGLWWAAFIGSMAAVNADTWATELGVLSPTPPRLVTTGAPVERGTSGGVSLLGSFASLAGAGLIGLAAALVRPEDGVGLALAAAIGGGMLGSLVDSLLGATLQAIYFCPSCQKETERHPRHTCGTLTTQLRGLAWLNNDWVNFLCALSGAGGAALIWWIIR